MCYLNRLFQALVVRGLCRRPKWRLRFDPGSGRFLIANGTTSSIADNLWWYSQATVQAQRSTFTLWFHLLFIFSRYSSGQWPMAGQSSTLITGKYQLYEILGWVIIKNKIAPADSGHVYIVREKLWIFAFRWWNVRWQLKNSVCSQ